MPENKTHTVPDAVLIQRHADDGLTKSEIVKLLNHLQLRIDEEVDAVHLNCDASVIFGFIRMDVSDRLLNYEIGPNSTFGREVIATANDATLETPDRRYCFAGVNTLMYY